MSLISEAQAFCVATHSAIGQKRKYTNDPYWMHPIAVADIVATMCKHDEEMIAAALLHDTVEDSQVTLDIILKLFGKDVADLVEQLTDVSKTDDGNRAVRKKIDLEHTAQASPRAKTIKLADLIHNSESILKYDTEFAKVYLQEKKALLEVLREGDNTLWVCANDIVVSGLYELEKNL